MSQQTITPFLMFEGRAEEAINYYVSAFEKSEIISIQRYGPNEAGAEGTVSLATFSLNGQRLMAIDSFVQHAFTFTPAMSFYVTCETEAEIDRLFERLSQAGAVLMPLAAYPFSPKFGWVQDQFGVSWQLSVAQG
jgi:predicted 3-demethylubiquinone-9 3-methyltransferase (glyoxalase superfamily)